MAAPLQRADGFVGQHYIVVPAPVLAQAGKHALLRGLLVTDAGYFPQANGHHVDRPRGAPTHLLITCLRGRGWCRSGARTLTVKPGDLLWLSAREPHAYGADADDPWTIGWVHFDGTEAEHWRTQIGFTAEPTSLLTQMSAKEATALKLDQIYRTLERGYSIPELIHASILLRTAFHGAADAVRNGGAICSAMERIAAVREHLRENFTQPHRLEELATAAGLSVPHFCTLFRRQTGFAPIDFLIRQRIQRACRLLDTTNDPVASIAAQVGYEDPYYFTRCFRRIVGRAPRDYRRIPKG